MPLTRIGAWLAVAGAALAALGGLLWLAGRLGLPLGRLPGDVRIEGEHASMHIPIATCILLSALVTLAVSIALRLFRS